MKANILLSFIVISSFATNAQNNNPYEVFGYQSKVVYETKTSDLFIIKNKDVKSSTKAIAFNIDEGSVLFLGLNDSILSKIKVQPDQLLRFLSVDPASAEYPSISPYAFVANNPINAIDPDGRRILFVNGFYMDNAIGRNIVHSDKGGAAYWGSGFTTGAQTFFNDKTAIGSSNFIDGSSMFGGDMSGGDRYGAGMAYAKANIKVLTADMVEGETFKMVTHSEGAAYGAGVAQYLIDQGYKVETIAHISADEGDEFTTPSAPMTYQIGNKGDWVTGNKAIAGVDKSGIVNSGLGAMSVHGSTRFAGVWKPLTDLKTVQTQSNIGMLNGAAASWDSQVPNTTTNGTSFSNVNGTQLSNTNGSQIGSAK